MGCDFYTYYIVCIQYKDNDETKLKKHILDGTRQRHYWGDFEDRDEDFEELNDYYDRLTREKHNQVEYELSNYKKVDIFKNGNWLCIESAREKYINLYKTYGISEKDIMSIWKQGDFQYR